MALEEDDLAANYSCPQAAPFKPFQAELREQVMYIFEQMNFNGEQ